jgi:hypothetical protein
MRELGVQSWRSFYRGEVGVKGGTNVDMRSQHDGKRVRTVEVQQDREGHGMAKTPAS